MELKVWVEGIQRIVCGASEKTTCQDVVYALAHATGKTGRFTLIERWRNNERLLAPQDHPLKVLSKWGEYSNDVQFILQRSPLDNNKVPSSPPQQRSKTLEKTVQPPSQVKQSHTFSGQLQPQAPTPAPIWKSPPSSGAPVSGRESDPTGSDTSNFSDQEKSLALSRSSHPPTGILGQKQVYPQHISGYQPQGVLPSGYQQQGWPDHYRHEGRFHSQSPDRGGEHGYGYTKPRSGSNPPPAYRPPPHPGQGSHAARNSSPAEPHPPPYKNPPPPPGSSSRHLVPMPTSPTMGRQAPPSPSRGWGGLPPPHPSPKMGRSIPHSPTPPKSHQFVRPHYSPPPHHREARGHPRGPSPGRNLPNKVNNSPMRGPPITQKSPTRGHSTHAWGSTQPNTLCPPHSEDLCKNLSMQQDGLVPTTDNYVDLFNLVSAQQTRIQSQHAKIKYADDELSYLDSGNSSSSEHVPQSGGPGRPWAGGQRPEPPPSQLDAVVTEVKRLENVAVRNERELHQLGSKPAVAAGEDGAAIRMELDQLKNRLEITDIELQKTNLTLRRLGDDLRSFSQEKSRQEEVELKQEMERIQDEIKLLQKSSEEGVNISDKLHQEVQDIENQISARKSEVEKLIQDMESANLESLTIVPPDGPSKPGTTRKMLGSPRELENAVPTSKNPNGVWV